MREKVFNIANGEQFNAVCLEVFGHQAKMCAPYARFLELIGVNPSYVTKFEQIPFMPIELFKSQKIYSATEKEQIIFTSSGTGGIQSKHYVSDLSIYEKSFIESFRLFYGEPSEINIYALLPSYLEREGSSLIYMIKELIDRSFDGGFFLYDYDNLVEKLEKRDKSRKTFLFGVTFALLDLTEQYNLDLGENVVVMETGGMKGRRRELPREELHQILCSGLGVNTIHSEYGMCECLSQSYSSGEGLFFSPPWQKIVIRSLGDPTILLPYGRRGGVNIIDLGNFNSLSFIESADKGVAYENGSFRVEGRIDNSDIRGCNLLI